MDPRKPIFDAVREAAPAGLFKDAGNIHALDNLLDAFGVPRADRSRHVGELGIRLIKRFEGCEKKRSDGRIEAYLCPAGIWTIGWGSTGPGIAKGTVWTQEQCDRRFVQDLGSYTAAVDRLLGNAPTTQAQFDALVSFAYNVGPDEDADTIAEGLGDSTLLKKHLKGDYVGAAKEFAKWNKARVRGKLTAVTGLTRRRTAEAELYRSGS